MQFGNFRAYVWRDYLGPKCKLIAQIGFYEDSITPDHACAGHPANAHPMVARDVLYWQHGRGFSDVLDGSATYADFVKLCKRYKDRGFQVDVEAA